MREPLFRESLLVERAREVASKVAQYRVWNAEFVADHLDVATRLARSATGVVSTPDEYRRRLDQAEVLRAAAASPPWTSAIESQLNKVKAWRSELEVWVRGSKTNRDRIYHRPDGCGHIRRADGWLPDRKFLSEAKAAGLKPCNRGGCRGQ